MSVTRKSGHFPLARRLLPIFSIVFLGVLISTLFGYFYTRQTVTDLALSHAAESLHFLNRELDAKVTQAIMNMRIWSHEDVFRLALEDSYLGRSAQQTAVERMQARVRHSALDAMYIVGPTGKLIIASTTEAPKRFKVDDRKYFHRAMSGEFNIETLDIGRPTGLPLLVIAAPLQDIHGATLGVMLGIIDIPNYAESAFEDTDFGTSSSISILGINGLVLASTNTETIGQTWSQDDLNQLRAALKSDSTAQLHKNAKTHILLAKHNDRSGWLLVVDMDEDEIFSPATRLGWISGSISLATLLLVIFTLVELWRALVWLRTSEETFSKLFLLSPTPIALVRLSDMTIQDTNNAFQALLDYTPEAVQGQTFDELRIFVQHGVAAQIGAKLHEQGKVESHEAEVAKRNQASIRCLISGQVVELDSQDYAIIIIFEDVSQLTGMYEKMAQTDKMSSLGGLAAGIAHEINNPLTAVIGFTVNARRRLFSDSKKSEKAAHACGVPKDKIREYLEMLDIPSMLQGIYDSGIRAAKIVENMLNFSRKSGKSMDYKAMDQMLDNAVELAFN